MDETLEAALYERAGTMLGAICAIKFDTQRFAERHGECPRLYDAVSGYDQAGSPVLPHFLIGRLDGCSPQNLEVKLMTDGTPTVRIPLDVVSYFGSLHRQSEQRRRLEEIRPGLGHHNP